MQTTNIACWLNQQITSVFQNLRNTCLCQGFLKSRLWSNAIAYNQSELPYNQSELQPYLCFGTEICMVKILFT